MIVFDNKYKFDKKDTLKHIVLPFKLNEDFNKLIINFKYSPSITPNKIARPIINEAVDKYIPDDNRFKEMYWYIDNIQLENLITTSLFHDGYYVGGWHNKSNNQKIKISKLHSSLGYEKHNITKGYYKIILSIHSVNCEVESSLKVEVV